MYNKELKYVKIEYSDKDLPYIDDLFEYIEQACDEIISFFGINEFGEKVSIKLWDSLDAFREYYEKQGYFLDENGLTPKWVCGFANGNTVHTLSLNEYKKTLGHENNTLQDLKYLVMHEFTHSCHAKLNGNKECYAWLGEGLATTITHQYENADRIFNITLEEAINGCRDYRNHHTMFCFAYETYGRDYILDLIKDDEMLKEDTPKLYEETVQKYGDNTSDKKWEKVITND